MPVLSGSQPRTFPQPIPVGQPVFQSKPAQQRQLPNGSFLVDRIDSSYGSRSGGTAQTAATINVIGAPTDQNARNDRLNKAVGANNKSGGVVSDSEAAANAAAVARRKQGVLGCIGKQDPTADCADCSTIDCLTSLLTGNLLDADAKKLLCDMIGAAERAAKNQIDATGNALLKAAQNLTSAAALKAPINTLAHFINGLNAGAVAKCFGADQLKGMVLGKLNDVNRVIGNAEKGVHDKLAAAFNKATEKAQQFSITPNLCDVKSPVSLRKLF